jgi:4-amino-4-deoxy-L-arabinose transferase-like glycosyltransferase
MSSVTRGATRYDAEAQQTGKTFLAQLLIWLAVLTAMRIAANAFANTDLFFDEAQYWFWSRELAFGYFSKPPLIGWIIRGATEICGSGEACIRAPSAILHAGTAIVVFFIAKTLYNGRLGFWAGLTYATLPGVSLSSSLISTDAPLLFFVALGLLSLVKLRESSGWRWALLLGVAIGFGFLAKYAMVYFLMCLAIALVFVRSWRDLLGDVRLYAALALGFTILAPNIIWNIQNSFATFSHTADNANWSGSLVKPLKALEFVGGQFGVFGPILFACLAVYCVRWLFNTGLRNEGGDRIRLLLVFSIPVILLMTGQALLSRAHANWAAFAYVAATVLIVAVLTREGWRRLMQTSLAIHMAVALLIPVGGVLAGSYMLPGGADPYSRVLGWRALADRVEVEADIGGYRAIATDKRALAAELLYYLRDSDIPIVSLRGDGPPSDHFEMTRPLTQATPGPVLFVGYDENGPAGSRPLGSAEIAAGPSASRRIHFHALESSSQ